MLEIFTRTTLPADAAVCDSVALDHIQREKARLKVLSRAGVELRIFLERGNALVQGEILKARSGEYVQVEYSVEPVVTARCDDWLTFSKACYHFGNRHTKLQIGERWIRFLPDGVLEDLAALLGLEVQHHDAVFDPESGAYQKGGSAKILPHSRGSTEVHIHSHNQTHSH